MKFSDITASVSEICDGRTFSAAQYDRWFDRLRKTVAMSFLNSGFKGLYFLYKEATVIGGSNLDNNGRYALPSDFVDDLNVFYDGKALVKSPSEVMSIVKDPAETGPPEWWAMAGTEFQLYPMPDVAGIEIKLVYNGLPEARAPNDASQEDYFMARYPDLHVFGMADYGAMSVGNIKTATLCKQRADEERKQLLLHNRRHWLKSVRMRFHNWDEYSDFKKHFFPQYQEGYTWRPSSMI